MPKIEANAITINYEQQGSSDPLILIPCPVANNACNAFEVANTAITRTKIVAVAGSVLI